MPKRKNSLRYCKIGGVKFPFPHLRHGTLGQSPLTFVCSRFGGPIHLPTSGAVRGSFHRTVTRRDWAEEVRQLPDVAYPRTRVVTLVCDNLNTHNITSLYVTFDAATSHRLARRLRIEPTSRNGSGLNMAEMELSVLARQCLGRQFESTDTMRSAKSTWQKTRNAGKCRATRRFTTADARIKLKSFYPPTRPFRVDGLIGSAKCMDRIE